MILRMEVDFPVLRLFVKWTGRPALHGSSTLIA
jgi:hypothetical protein